MLRQKSGVKNKYRYISSKDFMSIPAKASCQFLIIIYFKLLFELKTCTLKVHLCRFENLYICFYSYKNNILKISHS